MKFIHSFHEESQRVFSWEAIFAHLLACFTRVTIPSKNRGLLVVCPYSGKHKLISLLKSLISGNFKETRPWIASDCLPWLQKAAEDDPVARSCALPGLQVLHGILEKEIEAGGSVKSHFLARCAPTYFGMMSVAFNIQKL